MPKACQKDIVLETARDLILSEGYDCVTVRRIAREAGLTTGAIYSNFRNKAEILGILLTEAWEVLRTQIMGLIPQEQNKLLRLRLYFSAYRHFSNEYPSLFSLMMYVASRPDVFAELQEEVQMDLLRRRAELVNQMVELVQEMKTEGMLQVDDPVTYVVGLISAANGLLEARNRSLASQYGAQMDRVDELVMDRLINTLVVTPV